MADIQFHRVLLTYTSKHRQVGKGRFVHGKAAKYKKGGEAKKYKRGGEYNVSDSELASLLSSGYEFDILD